MPTLRWPDLRNARDLGGLPSGGGHIRERALVRTDNHDLLDAAGIAALDAYGVSRVVDLRWNWEAELFRSPLAGDPRYRLRPACVEAEPGTEYPTDSYSHLVDHSRDLLGAAVAAVADAPPGAVVVHCHAGRDRTGVVVALLLAVAGVPGAEIAADYALTPDSPSHMITNTLAHLDATHGGVQRYLLDGGCTAAHLDAVRARLLG